MRCAYGRELAFAARGADVRSGCAPLASRAIARQALHSAGERELTGAASEALPHVVRCRVLSWRAVTAQQRVAILARAIGAAGAQRAGAFRLGAGGRPPEQRLAPELAEELMDAGNLAGMEAVPTPFNDTDNSSCF